MAELNKWKMTAASQVSCGVGSRTSNIAENLLITKAYAKLYIENKSLFKWAGMAAYASDMVGMGIASGKALDMFVDNNMRSMLVPEPSGRLNATDLDNMLILGNKAVFRDIYWQHLAHVDGGLEALKKEIDRQGLSQAKLLKRAWTLIDTGKATKNQGQIWEGNTLLLFYEQNETLQNIYDRYPALSAKLSFYLISPLPFHIGRFGAGTNGNTIGTFANRWKWIVEVLLPEWRRLDAGSMLSEVKLIYMGQFPKRLICLLQ